MKILIITVAGMSTRFSQSLNRDCLKCIYYKSDITESLLYQMLHQNVYFDKYIIVGGYMYEQLEKVTYEEFSDYKDRIILVHNEKYAEYGSGYSLYKGLEAAVKLDFDEIVFAEGDLFVDAENYEKVCASNLNVITSNNEPILASKSVAYYFDIKNTIHYIYSTEHSALRIEEPFLSIFNSGQIWKFVSSGILKDVYEEMEEKEWQGTNLVFIQKYFERLKSDEYEIIQFDKWINCNTVEDFENYRIECDR